MAGRGDGGDGRARTPVFTACTWRTAGAEAFRATARACCLLNRRQSPYMPSQVFPVHHPLVRNFTGRPAVSSAGLLTHADVQPTAPLARYAQYAASRLRAVFLADAKGAFLQVQTRGWWLYGASYRYDDTCRAGDEPDQPNWTTALITGARTGDHHGHEIGEVLYLYTRKGGKACSPKKKGMPPTGGHRSEKKVAMRAGEG